MKMYLHRKIAMFMAVVFVAALLLNMNTAVVSAATPTFANTSVELVGEGKTYQMEIKDKVAKSTYSWSSSNKKVAKVSSKGLITAVGPGTTTIKCKITYPTKKTKTLSCKVTVTIPATEIAISNATLVNGAHVLKLGSTMDFNCKLTPANSSDKVYWSIGGGDKDCIRIDDAKEGKITALKVGKVVLRATAAKTASADAAKQSIVNDAVIIEVVAPTAAVKSAEIVDSNKLVVVFDSPVNASTVIKADGTLLTDNIQITLGRNLKNVYAADPGKLTASLSSDGKTLTITSEKSFNGNYGINFTSNITTTNGIKLDSSYQILQYTDTTGPDISNVTLDDTGRIVTISFTEPIDFSNMKIANASIVTSTGETADAYTLATLKNVLNYKISEDKQSLTIDLSQINPTDYGKIFSVTFQGLKDLQGNAPANYYLIAYITTDKSNQPQAICYDIRRTGIKTMTAFFTRAIQFGGYMQIENGAVINGIVDTKDKTKVNFTMSDAEALYTGYKTVKIRGWNSYNVYLNDTTANDWRSFTVDFTPDTSKPILVNNSYDSKTGILTLEYNESVTLTASSGTFAARFTSINDDILNPQIAYYSVAHTDGDNIIKIKISGISQKGIYTFYLNQGFVKDNFNNMSEQTQMLIEENMGGSSNELPPPLYIAQNLDDLSKITVRYGTKVDRASATTVTNYKIPGIAIISADLTDNSSAGATVVLTVAEGSIKMELDYPMTISGVKGYDNSFTAISEYIYPSLHLKENVKPSYSKVEFDTVNKNNIKMIFNEAITGSMQVKVTQYVSGYYVSVPVSSVNVSGNMVIIMFSTPLGNNSQILIEVVSNNIADLSGNKADIASPIPLYITY